MAKRLELLVFRNRWAWWRCWGGTRSRGTGVVADRRTVWLRGARLKHVEKTHCWVSYFGSSHSCSVYRGIKLHWILHKRGRWCGSFVLGL